MVTLTLAIAMLFGVAGDPWMSARLPGETELEVDDGLRVNSPWLGAHRFNARNTTQIWMEWPDRGLPKVTEPNPFSITRLRLKATGRVAKDTLRYVLQLEVKDAILVVKDAAVIARPFRDGLKLQLGQFKKVFGRQYIASSSQMMFSTRAITEDAFEDGRDLGLMVFGGAPNQVYEWYAGVLAGRGDGATPLGRGLVDLKRPAVGVLDDERWALPERWAPTAFGRLSLNSEDARPYDEVDLVGGPLRWSLAVAGWSRYDLSGDGGRTALTADGLFKVGGFSATGAVYVSGEGGQHALQHTDSSLGGHLQFGAQLSKLLMPSTRVAAVRAPDGRTHYEAAVGLTLFVFGHRLKWMNELGAQITSARDAHVLRWVSVLDVSL